MKTLLILVPLAALVCCATALEFPGFIRLGPVPKGEGVSIQADTSYFLSDSVTDTWSGALRMCADLGGKLAAPMNPAEHQALRIYLTQYNFNAHLWIGARKLATGGWRWESSVNLTPMIWSKWQVATCGSAVGEMCAFIYGSGLDGWCSKACQGTTYFVCEV